MDFENAADLEETMPISQPMTMTNNSESEELQLNLESTATEDMEVRLSQLVKDPPNPELFVEVTTTLAKDDKVSKSQSQGDETLKSQSQEATTSNSHPQKGETCQSHPKEGEASKYQSQEDRAFKSQSQKNEASKSQPEDVATLMPQVKSIELSKSSPEGSRKRNIEQELMPVLKRLPSANPSCSSDLILINKDQFKIGRKAENDAVLLNVLISRNHCVLYRDKATNDWFVTNLSSTDTFINNERLQRNQTEVIKPGDVLQLSSSDEFQYEFSMIQKNDESIKCRRLESNSSDLGMVLDYQRSFVESQENVRKDLEKELTAKQQEQEKLKQELDKLLEDQKVTKTCNEELNNQIVELQKKIEVGNTTELELQNKYRDLLDKLEQERLKFEEKLAEEKQKWQVALRETKEEKEKLEMAMVEKMEEWREQLQKKQEEEYQRKIDNLLQEEKSVQTKLQDEKQLLEQKLKEMEEALKKKEQVQQQQQLQQIQQLQLQQQQLQQQRQLHMQLQQQQQQQQQQQKIVATRPPIPINMKNCILVEVKNNKNVQKLPILETIDLTAESSSSSKKNCQNEAVIDKVNNIMDEQLTCSICSELLVRAMTLNCMHTFCRYCIEQWFKRRRECPNCRATITSMTRSLVVDNFIEKMLESLTPEQMQKRTQLVEERRRLTAAHIRKSKRR